MRNDTDRLGLPANGEISLSRASAKARLLWLFRNFYILDFPVLNPNQQQLIAEMWNSVSGCGSKRGRCNEE